MPDPAPARRTKPLRFADIGFVSLFFFLCSLSGFLTVVGNLTGAALRFQHIVPVVENLQGLMTTTLLLFFLGMVPLVPRLLKQQSTAEKNPPSI